MPNFHSAMLNFQVEGLQTQIPTGAGHVSQAKPAGVCLSTRVVLCVLSISECSSPDNRFLGIRRSSRFSPIIGCGRSGKRAWLGQRLGFFPTSRKSSL